MQRLTFLEGELEECRGDLVRTRVTNLAMMQGTLASDHEQARSVGPCF